MLQKIVLSIILYVYFEINFNTICSEETDSNFYFVKWHILIYMYIQYMTPNLHYKKAIQNKQ